MNNSTKLITEEEKDALKLVFSDSDMEGDAQVISKGVANDQGVDLEVCLEDESSDDESGEIPNRDTERGY